MEWHNEYTERMWRHEADAAERTQARNEKMLMPDWQAEPVALARCDGSGILEESYIDVDQTHVILCPGCCACEESDLEQATRRAPVSEPEPLWMGIEVVSLPPNTQVTSTQDGKEAA